MQCLMKPDNESRFRGRCVEVGGANDGTSTSVISESYPFCLQIEAESSLQILYAIDLALTLYPGAAFYSS